MVKFLVIDDEGEFMQYVSDVTKRIKGAEVHGATNAKDAMQIISTIRPDIVLADYLLMDSQSGAECFRHAKKINPKVVGIMITGCVDKAVKTECFNAGVSEIIEKPVPSLAALRTKLEGYAQQVLLAR